MFEIGQKVYYRHHNGDRYNLIIKEGQKVLITDAYDDGTFEVRCWRWHISESGFGACRWGFFWLIVPATSLSFT